jgi:fructose-1,6-bisphosphatase/inositol monophosphatase family enzyme
MDAIGEAIRQAALAAVVPRFRSLTADDVHEKSPGDIVTTADAECERLLVEALADLAPGVPVLGEEAAAADPTLMARLLAEPSVFLVDPLDGTRGFVAGSEDFAVMVALVEDGETSAAWIWQPMHDVMWTARCGEGTNRNGVRQLRSPATGDASQLRGAVKTGYLDAATRGAVMARFDRFADVSYGPPSAGFAYPALVSGDIDFLQFWRTLPWDHAPGALIAQEAGCVAQRLDGTPYRAAQQGNGLLSAAGAETWDAARAGLWED